jgi:hypothetical protein
MAEVPPSSADPLVTDVITPEMGLRVPSSGPSYLKPAVFTRRSWRPYVAAPERPYSALISHSVRSVLCLGLCITYVDDARSCGFLCSDCGGERAYTDVSV